MVIFTRPTVQTAAGPPLCLYVINELRPAVLQSDEGPYTKHSNPSRPPDGALAIRRQSIPARTSARLFHLQPEGYARPRRPLTATLLQEHGEEWEKCTPSSPEDGREVRQNFVFDAA
ncbi:hypothetical protein P4O66_002316 [Electrophorus voltai]|uniref:Uncharacterized protein n=1 Tax=Electrophorus voltai TaxID=2609070 RepID=A0AAD8Z1Y6_9TELE|nr:hypothetical protein P4O66_002316 [Electrophorus voltai]